jgi:hypothetical protein
MAAVSSLFSHLATLSTVIFRKGSIKFIPSSCDGTVLIGKRCQVTDHFIDYFSILNLELVRVNSGDGNVHGGSGGGNASLFECLDHTKTKMGSRLLRMNLLQPSTSIATIRSRQEAINGTLNI